MILTTEKKRINSNIYDTLNNLLDEIITIAMDTFYQLKLLNIINTSTSHVELHKASSGQ